MPALDLHDMYAEQLLLQNKVLQANGMKLEELTHDQICFLVKNNALSTIDECLEVVREFNWKLHKKYDNETFDKEKVLEEVVDVFKFWMNFLVYLNFSVDDFKKMFIKKSGIVEARFKKDFNA